MLKPKALTFNLFISCKANSAYKERERMSFNSAIQTNCLKLCFNALALWRKHSQRQNFIYVKEEEKGKVCLIGLS